MLVVVALAALLLLIVMPRERAFNPNLFAAELSTLLNLSAQAARSSRQPVSVRHAGGVITVHGSDDLAPLLESRLTVPEDVNLPQGELVRFSETGRTAPTTITMDVGRQNYILAISGLGGVEIR